MKTPIQLVAIEFIKASIGTNLNAVMTELGMLTMGAFMTFGSRRSDEEILQWTEEYIVQLRSVVGMALKDRADEKQKKDG